MKKIIFLFASLLICVSCFCDKEVNLNLSVSTNMLDFGAEGGEQIVNVESSASWSCDYTAEWLLVRQQQDRVRVIVDENPGSDSRTDTIKFVIGSNIVQEVTVTQLGVEFSVESSSIAVESRGNTILVPITNNVEWECICELGWCSTLKKDGGLSITVDRNYSMSDREGVIVVTAGDISHDITITQSACQWYESFEMIDVEGGTFFMGAQRDDPEGQNYDADSYQIEAPVHQVTLSSFAIGKFEVTQEQWMAAMGSNPSNIQGDRLPVENVSWEQVQSFITLLNEQSGLNYRLLTEAEWEFAARGGNLSKGYTYSGNSVLSACGWYYSNSEATTHEVGGKIANELGVYDMSGNVREWCSDWFGYYTSSEATDPVGPTEESTKMNRGGSWTTPAINSRNSYRHTNHIYEAFPDLGFRLALSN